MTLFTGQTGKEFFIQNSGGFRSRYAKFCRAGEQPEIHHSHAEKKFINLFLKYQFCYIMYEL